jgi:phosphate:Na+ symporter
VLIGAGVTMIVQSSSATMAITLTLAATGIIDIPTAAALVLGENIGTTITANIAALSASKVAKRTARAHFVFNVFGAVWGVLLFWPFLNFIDWMIPGDISSGAALSKPVIAAHVAMFHSMFNIVNTTIFLPFVNQLAKIATWMVKGEDALDRSSLKYLTPGLIESPPMALHATRQEIIRMVQEVDIMLEHVLMLIDAPKKKMGKVADAISASEQVVDYLEKEIVEYLVAITRVETSLSQSQEIAGFIGAVSDIERMGDHCESLHKLLAKLYDKKLGLSDHAKKELSEIGGKVKEFTDLLKENLADPAATLMVNAKGLEDTINDMRKRMRKGHVQRLNEGNCGVDAGLIFIDMLTSFEKMGDHAYNVSQMIAGER